MLPLSLNLGDWGLGGEYRTFWPVKAVVGGEEEAEGHPEAIDDVDVAYDDLLNDGSLLLPSPIVNWDWFIIILWRDVDDVDLVHVNISSFSTLVLLLLLLSSFIISSSVSSPPLVVGNAPS